MNGRTLHPQSATSSAPIRRHVPVIVGWVSAEFLTIRDAAVELRVSAHVVWQLIEREELATVQPDGIDGPHVRRADLDAFRAKGGGVR